MVFGFGKNWQQFLDEEFNQERLDISKNHLLTILNKHDLNDTSFLDIGCGSGLHSLAAFIAGSRHIHSIDVDINSVAATKKLWEMVGKPKNWVVQEGSALDADFLGTLGTFDIVYSWGVLHHTGDMWQAIKNATIPMHDNSVLYIALYADEVYHNPSPEYWLDIKKHYNLATPAEKETMEYDYAWEYCLKQLSEKGKNPLFYIKNYKKTRGMEFWTDVRDWLGGYPMEFIKTRDMAIFAEQELNMKINDVFSGEGNTEFLLSYKNQPTYLDTIYANCTEIKISENIHHQKDNAFEFSLSKYQDYADTDGLHYKSRVLMFEDGILLGFPHALHASIQTIGEGRFCHWKDKVFFASSDNSDPRTNGKKYTLRIPAKPL
jgi:SAM-dependent methyltransferase